MQSDQPVKSPHVDLIHLHPSVQMYAGIWVAMAFQRWPVSLCCFVLPPNQPPPPSVCVCIVRTITTGVDAAKSRTGALAPSQTLGVPLRLLCSPHLACGCTAAEPRAPATLVRAPLVAIHAPPSLSGSSATKLGVSLTVLRASALVSGAPCSKARASGSQGRVRRAMRAARRAHRAIARSNWLAREVLELGTPLETSGVPLRRCGGSSRWRCRCAGRPD